MISVVYSKTLVESIGQIPSYMVSKNLNILDELL